MTGFIDTLLPPAGRARGTLECRGAAIGKRRLRERVLGLSKELRSASYKCIALAADNGIDWIVADLACLHAGIRIVPVPLFFSNDQFRHVLASSGADAVLTDRPQRVLSGITTCCSGPLKNAPSLCAYTVTDARAARLPDGTGKITYTSGTTSSPKGVCLGSQHMLRVARSLVQAVGIKSPRHLCILPLSTLLENVAGVYAALLADGTVVAPSLDDVGLGGSSRIDIGRLLASITDAKPNTLILVPEILRALTSAAERNWRPPSSLRFVAVGGGKVAPELITRARKAGIPAFEGYGLSECGSVVSLNVPGNQRTGSVGRPLDHVSLRAEDGELRISGNVMLGYVDQPDSWYPEEIATGDLGHMSEDGFAFVHGRSKNLIISSFGRNISPEWVECELLSGGPLAQAVVVGDERPWCGAIVVAHSAAVADGEITAWIHGTNMRLPDYARIQYWARLPEPITFEEGLLTANGRPRRAQINAAFKKLIDKFYMNYREVSNQ